MGMVLYFLFTLFISTGTFFAATITSGGNSFLLWCIGMGIWIPFIMVVNKREKESRRKRERERMLDEWLRSQTRTGDFFRRLYPNKGMKEQVYKSK